MPIQLIQIGVPTDILQSVVYALPARKCFVQSTVAVEFSMTSAFSVAIAAAASATTGITIAAPFVRCPSANAVIIVKSDD